MDDVTFIPGKSRIFWVQHGLYFDIYIAVVLSINMKQLSNKVFNTGISVDKKVKVCHFDQLKV